MNFDKSQKVAIKKTPLPVDNGKSKRRNTLSASSRDEPDKKINLSDFLEFLRVSCHLNDLITNNNNETAQPSSASSGSSSSAHYSRYSGGGGGGGGRAASQSNPNNIRGGGGIRQQPQPQQQHPTIVGNMGVGGGGMKRKTTIVNDEIDLAKLSQSHVVDAFLATPPPSMLLKAKPDSKDTATTVVTTVMAMATSTAQSNDIAAEEDSEKSNSNNNYKSTTTITISANNSNINISGDSVVASQITTGIKCEITNGSGAATATASIAVNGLNTELQTKLDYVINEGVLDALLPFICPVAIPLSFLNRPRLKGQKPAGTDNAAQPAIVGAQATPAVQAAATAGATTTTAATTTVAPTEESTKISPVDMAKVTTKSKESIIKQASVRRKSLFGPKAVDSAGSLLNSKREPEVVIHVCDEVKNVSKDFTCSQSLLISKMGYFADVTAGQKLDDMDISVHCDIQIFDWLMKWVKHTATQEQNIMNSSSATSLVETGPQLDACNVVPILVSASFLQMEPLLEDCLSFCHARLNDVVRTSTNLACLNDSIVTRLAAMFTNVELEMVRDKKERVTPRLWTKLIQSLCETEPEALRGHYYSLSGLFRCVKCGNCLTNTIKEYVNCVPSNIRLNRWGQLVSHHVRDPQWDINTYIAQLFRELKSWRRVYWKLWGHCHFLYCCLCETHFPVYQMTWCRYHPESPNFLGPISEGCVPGPTGRHPCCGQQAFRYETLPGPNGCQFREHSVLVETDRERAIHSISQMVAEGNALCDDPPQSLIDQVAAANQRPASECRWEGLSLMPQRYRQGLLPALHPDDLKERLGRSSRTLSSYFEETSTDSEDTADTIDEPRLRARKLPSGGEYTSSSSDGCESECDVLTKATPRKNTTKKLKRRPTEYQGRFWSGELSARSNQDYQRDFEEKIMKHVCNLVNKKSIAEHGGHGGTSNTQPAGGSFIRLEAEWREHVKQRHANTTVHATGNSHTGLSSRQHRKI